METFTTEEIIEAIKMRADNFDEWMIGVTTDPLHGAHAHHGAWRFWHAGTGESANSIKQHFIEKGMTADPDETNAGPNAEFVYIY